MNQELRRRPLGVAKAAARAKRWQPILAVAALCSLSWVQAQTPITPEREYAKFVGKAQAIAPMAEFGEQISLRDGSVVFRATDLELPGIGPTIRITRTYRPNRPSEFYRETSGIGFGDWELEVPRVKTITANALGTTSSSPKGWQVTGSTDAVRNQRCSNFSAPDRITFVNDLARSWRPYEWWDGYHLVDESGSEQLLHLRSNTTVNPGYKLGTLNHWLVGCSETKAIGAEGEAFVGLAPDGTRYTFNQMVYTTADTLQKALWSAAPPAGMAASSPSAKDGKTPQLVMDEDFLERRYAALLVTRIEDRFKNWVTYQYSGDKLTRIDASDGRSVSITYDASGRISTISTGSGATARTWTYTYPSAGMEMTRLVVTRPDSSTWQYTLPMLMSSGLMVSNDFANCTVSASPDFPVSVSGTITSPAGATMSLTFGRQRFTRSYVPKQCWGGDTSRPDNGYAMYPKEWYAWALKSRVITGPGLPAMTWTYAYAPPVSSWLSECPTASSCASTVWTEVTSPAGDKQRSIFSNKFDETENLLLREEVYSASNVLLQARDHAWATVPAGVTSPYPWPVSVGNDQRQRVNNLTRGRWVPNRQSTLTRDGVTFTRKVDNFDGYARPVSVTRSSSLGMSLAETTVYEDNLTKWVMGQVKSITTGGQVQLFNNYDVDTSRLLDTQSFGVTQASYTWNEDGTLKTRSDGAGRVTTFSNWYRGFPQLVTFPTGDTQRATVDELGWVRSVTDEAGYTTSYDYDSMGRVRTIKPPVGYTESTLKFEPVGTSEFGLGVGHWRQTLSRGTARTVTYFDGLWRPVMSRTYDSASEASTRKVVVRGFDHAGRTSFESYPQRDASSISITSPGTRTSFDALSRPLRVEADSELGVLSTTYAYLSGLRTQITNPRNKVTTQSFWSLDRPEEAQLAGAILPEGVTLSISRDAWGKPTSISRGGVTRNYVYGLDQRLCKTVEPEIKATIQAYDLAGNVSWRAPGQPFTGTGTNACDTASVPAAGKISYGYDTLNRLTSTTYGDGSPAITRDYWPDGKLKKVQSNGSTWDYTYNSLRLLSTETLSYAGQSYVFTWGYNTNGHLSSLSYPRGGAVVSYLPNALGEPGQVTLTSPAGNLPLATAIGFHPNGAVSGYRMGNGIQHTLSQNLRGLPSVNEDTGVLKDVYAYDANANVESITDQQEAGVFSRTMGYDDLDRLKTANAPGVWGSAIYTYDAADNLRTANVGTRSVTLNYTDGTNRLNSLTVNGSTLAYTYDPYGNIRRKGGQNYTFDMGNRLTSSVPGGSNVYDGLGRRILVSTSDGARMTAYGQAGQLLGSILTGGGRSTPVTTGYVYLGGKAIAEFNDKNDLWYTHTDALGSPVARSNAAGTVMNRTRYEPFGYVAAGAKPGPQSLSLMGYTGHVQDPETDLVYMQQRYHDPIAGRFLSVDPIETDANTGKGFARFSYGENNPFGRIDPDGREPGSPNEVYCLSGSCQSDHINNPTIVRAQNQVAEGMRAPFKAVVEAADDFLDELATLRYGDSRKLGKDITRVYGISRLKGEDAHHIVAADDMRAELSRRVLDRYGVDVNSAYNGVFLPRPFHRRIHTDNYHLNVFLDVRSSKSRPDLIFRLQQIRFQMMIGSYPY